MLEMSQHLLLLSPELSPAEMNYLLMEAQLKPSTFSASLALGRSLGGSKSGLKAALSVSGECHKGQWGLGRGTMELVGETAKFCV